MSHRWLPMLLAALLLPAPLLAQGPPPPAPAPAAPKPSPEPKELEIQRLVQQLADTDFAKRAAAFKELKHIGPIALDLLRKTLESTKNTEVRRSAAELVQLLEGRQESELALTPTKVTLDFKDAPLSLVAKNLTDKTGYRFWIAEKDKGLADRRVTLSTGELPLWEAMDQLSRQARISVDLAGAGELWDGGQKENSPPKGRSRMPYQPARDMGEPGFVLSEAKTPLAETCHCGAVKFALCPSTPETAKAEKKPPATDASRLKRDNPPARPGAQGGIPPAQANGPGAAGGGGGGGGPPQMPGAAPSQEQKKKALKDKEENRPVHTVILEIQTEPRLQWYGPLQLRTEPLLDEKKQEVENVGTNPANRNDPGNRPVQVLNVNPNGQQIIVQGEGLVPYDPYNRNGKHQIALNCRLPENPGKYLPVLKGCLVGQVMTPMTIEVPDVANAGNAVFKGKDGLELQVIECKAELAPMYKVTVELSVPGAMNQWGPGAQMQMNRLGPPGGRRGGNILNATDFAFTDAKGRPMRIMGRSDTPFAGKAGILRRLTFTLRGVDAEAVPGKMVYTTSRLVTIEAPFEFKNVPLQ